MHVLFRFYVLWLHFDLCILCKGKFLSKNNPIPFSIHLFSDKLRPYLSIQRHWRRGIHRWEWEQNYYEKHKLLREKCTAVRSQTRRDLLKDTHPWSQSWKSVLLKYRPNDWITVSSFGDSVIVGLQTVRSIDFLSDAMKPRVPSLCKLAGWEGGRQMSLGLTVWPTSENGQH